MPTRPIIYDMIEAPASSVMIALCVGVWLYLTSRNWGYSEVGISYSKFVEERQYWRAITASFSHVSILHLGFNMSSLWSCAVIEKLLGVVVYLKYTYLLVVLSMVIVIATYHILITRFGSEQHRHTVALGYSCVVFGWMTILQQQIPDHELNLLGVLKLPLNLAPFGSLIFTSLIIPRASFIGHLSGIIVGYLISWHVFDWFTDYLFLCCFVWTVIGFVASLKTSSNFPLPFIQIHNAPTHSSTITNGILTRTSNRQTV
eukprot:TRINITY_DN13093_c0_g1_i1.p1 TRINITY_DN13093_c0_g1~~TRINITY_DN13093_c0_g1_i1.p1  ORF type:complete len:259 (-),score=37.81 TRINITY_DN13093_c0_g1_i1:83-859(-)